MVPLGIADGAIDLVSFDDYKLNTFNMSMVVIKEMTRIAVVINASVNVYITFWSSKRVKEEMHKVVNPLKKVLSQVLTRSED